MARLLTYTPAVHRRIVDALRRGAPLRDAVGYAGAEWPSFCRWLRMGRLAVEDPANKDGDARFAPLARDIDQAVAESNVALLGLVRRQAEDAPGKTKTKTRPAIPPRIGDWRAAAFLLEFRAEAPERRARLRKLRADAEVAKKRADGSLPPSRSEVTGAHGGPIQVNALHSRLAALAAEAAGGPDADAAGETEPGEAG
ncbi:MAG: hypothetical protein Q8S73_31515 [Deltaproteobacteria bacterium]|nr:hypothetical protein [Myxococcales bacterium]MDP3218675.1 hypothetical protein [Deltaproteobacteria bacterium]